MSEKKSLFKKGVSGNPAGRPVGYKCQMTILRSQLMQASPDLINFTIEKALSGDMKAMQLCIERILPRSREEKLRIKMSDLKNKTPETIVEELLLSISDKEVTTDEIATVLNLVKTFKKNDDESITKVLESTRDLLETLRENNKKEY